jgi:hypothetical protein
MNLLANPITNALLRPATWLGREVMTRRMRAEGLRQEPIALLHGFMGFRELGPFEYFMGVQQALGLEGFIVHAPTVAPINRFEYRAFESFYGRHPSGPEPSGDELIWRPRPLLRRFPIGPHSAPYLGEIYLRHRRPMHLIAHSQAATNARFLASPQGLGNVRPFATEDFPLELRELTIADTIASITTVSGPHNGVLIADDTHLVTKFVMEGVFPIFDSIAGIIGGDRSDLWAAAREFGCEYMLGEFNPTHREHPDIRYYSVQGLTDHRHVNLVLRRFYDVTKTSPAYEHEDNDGFVPLSSGRWPVRDGSMDRLNLAESDFTSVRDRRERNGDWLLLGHVFADHMHQIGFPFSRPGNPFFRHLDFYSGLARFVSGELDDDVFLHPDGRWGPLETDVAHVLRRDG